jgi:ubiquinone/menaquinone biosynthesis C-methylase UbiE
MTISAQDYRAFVDFEKNAWVKLFPHYDSLAGQMTRQAVGAVLDAAELRPGDKLLDVATGIGYVAAAARQRGADATGVDFSPDMIDLARRQFPELKIELGDAENLSHADASFDAVTCAYGMLHFPRPGKALAEAHRVLRPGGRHAFTVWCGPAKNKFFGMMSDIILRYADPAVGLPTGPGQYMLSDPMVCAALMDAARYDKVRIEEIPTHFTARAVSDVLEFLRKCAPRAIYILDRQRPDVRAKIEEALLAEGAAAIAQGGGKISCPSLLVTGIKSR